MLQNTIETLAYVLFLLPGETSTERAVYVGVLRLGNFAFAMETQHHGRSQHCKDFKGKEWDAFILLPRTKKGFSALFTKRALQTKEATQWWKAVKVAWSTSHCSKADARETNNNRSVKLQKLYMDKKKSSYRTNDTDCSKKQFGWLYSFAITYKHSNCSVNLQRNHTMAFGRVVKTNKSFYLFLGWSSSFEGSPLRMLASFFLEAVYLTDPFRELKNWLILGLMECCRVWKLIRE